jgi:aspartyl protease family protein
MEWRQLKPGMARRRWSHTSTYIFVVLWLGIGAIAYVSIDHVVAPRVARPGGHEEVQIERSYDQHFYVEGTINGRQVTFMVDTGATIVSVNAETASKIGLADGVSATFDTAGGRVVGRIIPDSTVQIGRLRVEGIRVGVNPGGPAALLGQNFLNKIDDAQKGDRLILRSPSKS